jgi:hypothetical protein
MLNLAKFRMFCRNFAKFSLSEKIIRFAKIKRTFSFSRKCSQKSPKSFCFRENFRGNTIFFQLSLSFAHTFAKLIFLRKSAKISSKYSHKNSPFVSHVVGKFCFFVISLKKSQHLLIFAAIFVILSNIFASSNTKMQ